MHMQTGTDAPRTWANVHRILVGRTVVCLDQSGPRAKHDPTLWRVTIHPKRRGGMWQSVGDAYTDKATASDVFNVALRSAEIVEAAFID